MRLNHLVVVVPGIAGSRLESDRGPAWEARLGSVARAVLGPSRLSLSEHPDLQPAGVTPAGTLPWLGVVHSLGSLTENIRGEFTNVVVDECHYRRRRNPAADVVVFSYDFRRSVADAAGKLAAEVDARLTDLPADGRADRVVVVTHSLGGLVARYWLGPLGGWRVCRALITLGTPHRGAPKALDWLVNGPRVGRLPAPWSAEATAVLAEWPSMYELLPRYPAVLDARTGGALYPHELPHPVLTSRTNSRAKDAYSLHLDIERAWAQIPPGRVPEVVPVFTRGHGTPARTVLDGTTLTVSKQDAEWLPNVGWGGDSTVPAISAIPVELDKERGVWLPETRRHLALPSSPFVAGKLLDFCGESLAAVRGGERPERPWLGVDVDELLPAGEPVPVHVALHGARPGPSTALWARLRPDGGPPGEPVAMARDGDGDRWTVELPSPEPGLYALDVRAVGVPGADAVSCRDPVGVIAG